MNAAILIMAAATFTAADITTWRTSGCLPVADSAAGRDRRQRGLRAGAAGFRSKLDPDRNPGRADRHGRLSEHPPPPLAAPPDHPRWSRSFRPLLSPHLGGRDGNLLIFSQVVLSLQLSFAVIPLVIFTSDRNKMGEFVNAPWLKSLAWVTAVLIAVLNVWLLALAFRGA